MEHALINLVVLLIVLGLIFYLVTFLLGKLPVPEPFRTVIYVVTVAVICIILIYALLGLVPSGRRLF